MKGKVAVVGVGMANFGPRLDKGLKALFIEAFDEAMADADRGVELREIDEAFIGHQGIGGGQLAHVGPHMTEAVGLPSLPVTRVENACASSSYAFRMGVNAILSGEAKVVLVGGVEKITEISGNKIREWMGVAGDVEWDRSSGLTFPGVFALSAMLHMEKYGTTKDQLLKVAVKNHENGFYNPKAHLRRRITLDQAKSAPMVSYPLNVFDCCVNSSGAACLILCDAKSARNYSSIPVYLLGTGAASDVVNINHRRDPATFDATVAAAQKAYASAGVTPKDIDLIELHDCFTISEIINYEDLGLCKKGHGGKLIEEGRTYPSGDFPVNPSGGLKSKGHPTGATGAAQIYEVVHQLRGDVSLPERQVRNAEIGMTHNMGGFATSVTVNIFGIEG